MNAIDQKRSGGFSLLDVLSVLLVFSVLAVIAVPQWSGEVARSRVDKAAAVVAGDLELAFSLAARQGAPVRIGYDAETSTYRFIDRSSGGLLHARHLGANAEVPVRHVSFSAATLDVFPRRIASGPLTVTLEAGEATARVEMLPSGLIRVEKP